MDGAPVSDESLSFTKADKVTVTNSVQVAFRAYSNTKPGIHTFSVSATQSDGKTVQAFGNFEVVAAVPQGRRAKNVIYLIGDGFGIAHRTAARIMGQGCNSEKPTPRWPSIRCLTRRSPRLTR